jgi:hypothetical protein
MFHVEPHVIGEFHNGRIWLKIGRLGQERIVDLGICDAVNGDARR